MSETQVALHLIEFIEDFGGDWVWDEFVSVPIENPQLESIRARASQVTTPVDDEGLATLRFFLSEVENLIEQENHLNETAMDNVQYIHLAPEASLQILPTIRPFSAVVIISAEVTSEWRHMVSEWLVEQGCLCMMAWGIDCSLWDDSVDIANLEAHNWDNIPDSQRVMTKWHEKEPLSDVLWSAHFSIFDPPDTKIEHLVILDIITETREPTIRELYAKSCNKVE